MSAQNYANHKRIVPLFHYGLSLILVGALAASGWNALRALERGGGRLVAVSLLLLTLAGMLLFWYSRIFALTAQDRAIRAEENLRHFAMTGSRLDPRLGNRQIIALRFASDEEFVALANRAAEENLSSDAIKKAIQSWKADTHRV